MPNAKVLSEKKKVVEGLTEKLKSQAGVFVDYSGINVNEDTEMRVKLREANIEYTVIKNTLMRFAIKNVGFEELDPILNGTTSLAISKEDSIAPARVIKEYVDKFSDYFEIKAGFMDGKVLSAAEVIALASIPPLPILQAQLLGTMLAPIASLAVVLKAIAENGGKPADVEVAIAAQDVKEEAPAVEAATVEDAATPVEETATVEAADMVTPAEEAATVEETPTKEATPAEEAAPVEEATPAEDVVPEEATPAPEETVAPAQEATPAEEIVVSVKEEKKTPEKSATKTKEEDSAEAPAKAEKKVQPKTDENSSDEKNSEEAASAGETEAEPKTEE